MDARGRAAVIVAVAVTASLVAGVVPATATAGSLGPAAPVIWSTNGQLTRDGTVYVRGTVDAYTTDLVVSVPSGITTVPVASGASFTVTVTIPVAREATRITLTPWDGSATGAPSTLDAFNLGALPGYGRFVLVDKYDFTLYFIRDGIVAFKRPVAIGMPGAHTPTGTWWTGKRQWMPVRSSWGRLRIPLMKAKTRKVRVTVHVGRRHVRRWVRRRYYVKTSYYLHGTNDPSSIGTMASHGCIRMYNWDVVALSPMLGRDPVVIRN